MVYSLYFLKIFSFLMLVSYPVNASKYVSEECISAEKKNSEEYMLAWEEYKASGSKDRSKAPKIRPMPEKCKDEEIQRYCESTAKTTMLMPPGKCFDDVYEKCLRAEKAMHEYDMGRLDEYPEELIKAVKPTEECNRERIKYWKQ